MHRLFTRTLLATGAASAAMVLAASSASAETFTVTGANADGHNHGSAGVTTLTVSHNGSPVQLTCDSSEATSQNLFDGTSDGTDITEISNLTFTTCRLSTINFTVTSNANGSAPAGGPWILNAESKDGAGKTSGHIVPQPGGLIHAHIHGANVGCEIDVDGHFVGGNYDNNDLTLHVPGGDPLTDDQDLQLTSVTGCLGLVGTGDQANFQADYFIDDPAGLQIN